MTDPSPFAASWDEYAGRSKPAAGKWPGDEWGSPNLWRAWFDRLFVPAGVEQWRRAVEIGQGGGKYTALVLESGRGEIAACDVSQRFLDVCAQRFATEIAAGRLRLRRIAEDDPRALQGVARELGWLGTVDAVYSIDTLVHVEFTAVAAYLCAATELLRPGGHWILTFRRRHRSRREGPRASAHRLLPLGLARTHPYDGHAPGLRRVDLRPRSRTPSRRTSPRALRRSGARRRREGVARAVVRRRALRPWNSSSPS
ncbi:MAG: class I SAM-dependent methyltransferase [Planctomycetes bacterium]|nr:class I SAM-dependent methyltransferase [Planctomycetota bacterium]